MANPLLANEPIVFPDFGPYLRFAEAIKSDTARRKGLSNNPDEAVYDNMVRTYHQLLVPIFDRFGKLPINSFYRSPEVNRAVGGSKTSAHMFGQAVDLDCDSLRTLTNKQLYNWIAANLDFDQLILEAPDKNNNPGWVHVSYRSAETNRKQTLKMVWQNGKQVYQTISGQVA